MAQRLVPLLSGVAHCHSFISSLSAYRSQRSSRTTLLLLLLMLLLLLLLRLSGRHHPAACHRGAHLR
jgi:hypothetical protein